MDLLFGSCEFVSWQNLHIKTKDQFYTNKWLSGTSSNAAICNSSLNHPSSCGPFGWTLMTNYNSWSFLVPSTILYIWGSHCINWPITDKLTIPRAIKMQYVSTYEQSVVSGRLPTVCIKISFTNEQCRGQWKVTWHDLIWDVVRC